MSIALAESIHRHPKACCAELHRASRTNEIDAWLVWLADIVLEAQARMITDATTTRDPAELKAQRRKGERRYAVIVSMWMSDKYARRHTITGSQWRYRL